MIQRATTAAARRAWVYDYRPGSNVDFERLYRKAYPRVLATLMGVLHDRAAAEDAAHEAFERAFKAWRSWRPLAPAEAWVHRIAINVAVSHRRRQGIREVNEVIRRLGRPVPAPDPAAVAERSDLLQALRRLPAAQAAAIVLRHYHGYSNREIAAATRIPERTVASRLATAKARLRAMLEGKHPSVPSVTRARVTRPAEHETGESREQG